MISSTLRNSFCVPDYIPWVLLGYKFPKVICGLFLNPLNGNATPIQKPVNWVKCSIKIKKFSITKSLLQRFKAKLLIVFLLTFLILHLLWIVHHILN